jgi:uncharacterized protein YjbI with pentapeptide repeats
MSVNFPRRRRSVYIPQEARQRDPGETRLWNIGVVLAVSFTVAVVGLVGLTWLAWVLLGAAGFRSHGHLPQLKDTVSVLQLVFASVAGAGALVALIVAYRRQKIAEADSIHDRTRVFNERFTAIATQLGDAQPAVRLAGAHAMAGLADDWKQNRQTCVDVLCACLRLPSDPDPGDDASPEERTAYRANRAVRQAIIRLIGAHLSPEAAVSWQDLNLDFTSVVFDDADFSRAQFSGGRVSFDSAEFTGGGFSFVGGAVGPALGRVRFDGARFADGQVSFDGAKFTNGQVSFDGTEFTNGQVSFDGAKFTGSWVSFDGARFANGDVSFTRAMFTDGEVLVLEGGVKHHPPARVSFDGAKFTGGRVFFGGAEFWGGQVRFDRAEFTGSRVSFTQNRFTGGEVHFELAADWSSPPYFDWKGEIPSGVTLPSDADAAR